MTAHPEFMLPLKTATQRASLELNGLHARLERLEHGLDAVLTRSADALDTETIEILQELDMLRQSVGALSDYLERISATTDDAGLVDLAGALSNIPLRDMATRLGGQTHSASRAGQAELF
jgi:hypothetical protein